MNEERPYDESPEQRRHIRDAIDACRPVPLGAPVEDLNQPELEFLADLFAVNPQDRERLARSQKFDRRIQSQLSEVPVPEGLASRILGALDQGTDTNVAASSRDALNEALADRSSAGGEVRPAVSIQPTSSLKWLVGGAIAAAIAFLVVSMLQTPQPLLVDDVHSAAQAWAKQQNGVKTIPVEGPELQELITNYPLSQLISGAVRTSASKLSNFLERQGAVYTLTAPDNSRAELLVVRLESEEEQTDIPIGRPKKNPFNTQGLSMLAWREEGLLYVLVVPDGEVNRDPVQQFLDLDGAAPIALHHRSLRLLARA